MPGVGTCGVFPLLRVAANIAACAAAWKPRLPTPAMFSTFAVAAVVLAALDTTGAAGLVVPTPAELELITWRQRGAQELLYRNEIDDTEQHVQHAPFSRAESGP